MEGIQTINALKAVVSSLPAQTTIPSGELVTLYAADGTPIAKISRDDLVKAVASVMASNSQNTFSKLLGVQANGTPMGIGASDLASVLGGLDGLEIASTSDLDDFKEPGTYWWREYPQNSGGTDTWCYLIVRHLSGTRFVIQEIYRISGDVCLRTRVYDSGTWGAWVTDPDSYLYNCPTPAALASLLGDQLWISKGSFSDTEDWHRITSDTASGGILFIGTQYSGYAIYYTGYEKVELIGGRTDFGDNIYVDGYHVYVKHCNYMLFSLSRGGIN